jgi:hypothetical protein
MHWEFIVALVIAIPVILFPVAFIWYLNVGGIYAAVREARKRRVVREQKGEMAAATEKNTGK